MKLSSLAKTYAKRIAIADGNKNCKFCGRILSYCLTKSVYASNEPAYCCCCDRYHRLFRLAVNYSEMLNKRYRQQRRNYNNNRQKLIDVKNDELTSHLNESSTNGVESVMDLVSKLMNDFYL
ncbi:unnamed protein product [Schistosoma turkestanicum]|nr:unnamed protein product [Schistosoma turkestanicum]